MNMTQFYYGWKKGDGFFAYRLLYDKTANRKHYPLKKKNETKHSVLVLYQISILKELRTIYTLVNRTLFKPT